MGKLLNDNMLADGYLLIIYQLSDEIGHDRFFLDRIRNAGGAARFDTFEEPGHIAAELAHYLHTFFVLTHLVWSVAVYHIPIF